MAKVREVEEPGCVVFARQKPVEGPNESWERLWPPVKGYGV